MRKTSLDQDWKFIDMEPGQADFFALSQPGVDLSSWQSIGVPGDINAVLVASGRMPDPHVGDNGRQCYWVTSKEWILRREFARGPWDGVSRRDLCLDGVDGHADVYLNGELLGRMENAFRPRRFDAREKINSDATNVLLIRFLAIDEVLGQPRQDELAGWRGLRALMRKPQFSFGWDWSLPLPSIGIMGSVWLEEYAGPRLLDVSVQTHLSGRLDFKFRVNSAARTAHTLQIRVWGHGANLEKTLERKGRAFSHTSLQIENPRLWQPHGMGEPFLYHYEVVLEVDGQEHDRRSGRLGIREVRILEEPFTEEAGPGISFWIEVNGQRVFCKGGNMIPFELWPATATDDQYRFYLQKTVEAGFNMQRLWGGGIYEKEIFYDLCDELGIMVWQDFMFASTGYPLEKIRYEIMAEAEHQVLRLRNRPSIVLWCGCNEDCYSWSRSAAALEAMADTGVYSESAKELVINRLRDDPQLYSMILRGTVSRLGLGVPFIESSPQSYEDAGNLPESGNCHISCWKYALFSTDNHPERFRGHFEAVCSFDSEFCIQGPCGVETFERFMPKEHLWPPDDVWVYYIQRGHANLPHHEQTLMIAGALFGEIDSLQKYVKYGQATHAEQMRAEFESARRDRPNNGGTMMWMYNDCRPTSNWSIIDYFRRPKPSYYAARRASAMFLPIIFERGGRVEFFFSNDGPLAGAARLRFGQQRLDGTTLWEECKKISFCGVDTVKFHVIDRSALEIAPDEYLFIDATVFDCRGEAFATSECHNIGFDGGKCFAPTPRVTYFPQLWKEVPWPSPRIDVMLIGSALAEGVWRTRLKVTTDVYARFCHLIAPKEAGDVWFDENYFDLCAGGEITIEAQSSRPLDTEAIRVGHWHSDWL